MRWLLLFFFFLLFLGPTAFAKVINAASANLADVQAAINSANPGDTVTIPAGSATWSSGVVISKSLYLTGSGANSSFIIRASGFTGSLVSIGSLTSDVPVQVSNINFNNVLVNPSSRQYCVAVGPGTNAPWPYTKIRIHDCTFQYGSMPVAVFNWCYGVLDHCTFYNSICSVYIQGDDNYSWARPIAPGTANSWFVEDCTFAIDNNLGSVPHDVWVIYHQEGGRSVMRHCIIDGHACTYTSQDGFYDAHGNQNYWTGNQSSDFRGTVLCEFYNNTIHTYQNHRLADLRGGSFLWHDNTYTVDTGSAPNIANMRDEEDDSSSGHFSTYRSPTSNTPPYVVSVPPCEDTINATFFWNNSWSGGVTGNRSQEDSDFGTWCNNDSYYIARNRDYWTQAPSPTTTHTYPQPASPSSASYPTVYQNITSYTPYTYPHPLVTGVQAPPPPTNLRIE